MDKKGMELPLTPPPPMEISILFFLFLLKASLTIKYIYQICSILVRTQAYFWLFPPKFSILSYIYLCLLTDLFVVVHSLVCDAIQTASNGVLFRILSNSSPFIKLKKQTK